jgi:ferredoxin-NADP reductase
MEYELILKSKKTETHDSTSFIFEKPPNLNYTAGQFFHWTLPHDHPDERGIKRFFTISSSPSEDFVMLTTKFSPDRSSTFKLTLKSLQPGSYINTTGPSGNFILPENPSTPVVFLGGGIGITPFRSMIKYAIDTHLPTSITLIYANKTPGDVVYKAEFDSWTKENINFQNHYTVDYPNQDWHEDIGHLTTDLIKRYVLDLSTPIFYICGPLGMIQTYEKTLWEVGVHEDQIRTENFSGY